jgi:hypothetical protein
VRVKREVCCSSGYVYSEGEGEVLCTIAQRWMLFSQFGRDDRKARAQHRTMRRGVRWPLTRTKMPVAYAPSQRPSHLISC